VDEALLVGVLQAQSGLAHVIARLQHRQRAGLLHHLGQIDALHEFHGQVIGPGCLAGIEARTTLG